MHAIIQTGGKQYRVAIGDLVEIEKLASEPGHEVTFETLLVVNGDKVLVGQPSLGQKVTAEVVAQTQGEKLIAYKYKRRKGYDRKIGHRQPLTQIRIKEIGI